MDWKWEVVSLVCSTHTPFHDKVTDNGDGTFTHTLTPKQESAYVAGWRKIHSLSDLKWATLRYEKHYWVLTPCGRWCCQRCGKEEIGTPDQDSPCQPKPTPPSVHKWRWDGKGILCKDCGCGTIDSPKTCEPPKRHNIKKNAWNEEYYCFDCDLGWDARVYSRENLEAQVCEGTHAEHSTQHSRREGTHS